MSKIKYPLYKLKYCRKCINETFGMNLQRKNLYVYSYPIKCCRCGEYRKIIYKARFPYNIILDAKIKRMPDLEAKFKDE